MDVGAQPWCGWEGVVALRSDVAWADGNVVSALEVKTGNIFLPALVEGGIDLQNGLWRRFGMIYEVGRSSVAE